MNKPEFCGAPAEPTHSYSTVAAGFSGRVIGSVNAGQWSCGGRPGAKRDPRDWPGRLFSRHAGLLSQENSTEEKSAESSKKKGTKQHKQVVTY